ncbi:MAG TPA: O-antigen ligase family protein [Candidatus Saccharimonadales bacterium]|nr:O-antigen ligase family protein [Candidatus Saccharimonadales bacterium]
MKNNLSSYLDSAILFILLIVAGVTPLLFLNQTTEFYSIPKLTFLIFSTAILLGLWIFSWIVKGKIAVTRTPLDIPLLGLLAAVLISTFFSSSRLTSIYGNFPNIHGSAASWVIYILLYFVAVSQLKTISRVKSFLYVIYASGIVVALISLFSFFHLYLPFDLAKAVNFTPTGSSFSTIAFLILLMPLSLISIFQPKKFIPAPVAIAISILFGVTVILIGSLSSFITVLITFALCLLMPRPKQIKKSFSLFLIPLAVIVLTFALAYSPVSIGGLSKLESNFPKEIQLPLPISWKVSASAFRDAPFVGTGPSTYLFDFTSYKPVEYNLEKFWNFTFDTPYNEFLQILASLGLVGLVGTLYICFVVVLNSWKSIASASKNSSEGSFTSEEILAPALGISAILSIVLLAIHASTLISIVYTLFIFALLMASQKNIREKVTELSMGIKATSSNNKNFDVFPVITFIIFLIAAVPVLIKTTNVVKADYYHRLALSQANKSGTLAYQYLQKAESTNPQVDLYRVDMAQINFALANAIATNATKTKKPLSDADKKTIQTLLSQSVNEGRVAVALSPRSSRNWEVLGSIYRNISGVAQNALAFSLDAYGKAIQRDPLNPALRLSVGGIYYSAKNYDLAIRFFSDAANLKPDYVTSYFNLSIALRDKGDFANAKLVAEQTVSLLQKDKSTPDYKIAVKLLDELKAKVVSEQKATAAQTGNDLNKTNANVNVSDLNNPPQVATPEAVKKNPNTKLPQSTTQQ